MGKACQLLPWVSSAHAACAPAANVHNRGTREVANYAFKDCTGCAGVVRRLSVGRSHWFGGA